MIKRLAKRLAADQAQYSAVETLIMVVLVAIGLSMVLIEIGNIRAHHRDNERKADIAAIQQAVLEYHSLHGSYPVNLTQLPELAPSACREPRGHGDCHQPDYQYRAFKAGTDPAVDLQTNCGDKSACVGYIIFTKNMDRTSNPYLVRSY